MEVTVDLGPDFGQRSKISTDPKTEFQKKFILNSSDYEGRGRREEHHYKDSPQRRLLSAGVSFSEGIISPL